MARIYAWYFETIAKRPQNDRLNSKFRFKGPYILNRPEVDGNPLFQSIKKVFIIVNFKKHGLKAYFSFAKMSFHLEKICISLTRNILTRSSIAHFEANTLSYILNSLNCSNRLLYRYYRHSKLKLSKYFLHSKLKNRFQKKYL